MWCTEGKVKVLRLSKVVVKRSEGRAVKGGNLGRSVKVSYGYYYYYYLNEKE